MMTPDQTTSSYNVISKLFHWIVVYLLVSQFVLIWLSQLAFRSGPSFGAFGVWMVNLHKMMGLAVLGISLIRLLWRWIGGLPAWADGLADWEKKTAHVIETWLYLFLFLMPISGITHAIVSGFPITFFGYLVVPVLMEHIPILANSTWFIHMLLGYALVCIIALHLGFIARRSIFEKDHYTRRMRFTDKASR